jgi:NAD(P)-dependent dehydrogenase (short-subunit alcohol dehydrogenase family)
VAYKKPNIPAVHFPDFLKAMPDLTGKTFVISGTTSGTGRVASRAIAQKGGRVIMLNRASTRSEQIQNQMGQDFPKGQVTTIECDLQRFTSVRSACEKLHAVCSQEGIDALINNAGIMATADEATEDGFDTQMQTNHLSHFLLTKQVFSLLQKAADLRGEARIVNHSSMARKAVKKLEGKYLEANGGNLGGNGASMWLGGARWTRYGHTKLANAAFTAALHHRLRASDSKVKALVAHPGWANTELQVTTNKAGGLAAWNSLVARLASQHEEDGALGILSCAVLPDAQCGAFYGPGLGMMASKGEAKPYALEPQYDNPETRDLLWNKSCEAIGEAFDL